MISVPDVVDGADEQAAATAAIAMPPATPASLVLIRAPLCEFLPVYPRNPGPVNPGEKKNEKAGIESGE
jgi:hypothetical protein